MPLGSFDFDCGPAPAWPAKIEFGEPDGDPAGIKPGQTGVSNISGQGLEQMKGIILHPIPDDGKYLVIVHGVPKPVGLFCSCGVEFQLYIHVETSPGLAFGSVGTVMSKKR